MIILYLVICFHTTYLHRKIDFNHITRFPVAYKGGITIILLRIDFGAVYRNAISLSLVCKWVEICGYGSVLRPSGDTHTQSKLLFFFGSDGNTYLSVPRIACSLFHIYFITFRFNIRLALDKEIDIHIIALSGIHIIRYGSHETGYVARTAGTSEPVLALMLPHGFQRIVIEELVTAEWYARNDSVIQRAFQHIRIFGISRSEKHTMIPIHIGYRGAGFAIGCVIIQFIVRTESFTLWAGTDSACDKEFFAGHIFPNTG